MPQITLTLDSAAAQDLAIILQRVANCSNLSPAAYFTINEVASARILKIEVDTALAAGPKAESLQAIVLIPESLEPGKFGMKAFKSTDEAMKYTQATRLEGLEPRMFPLSSYDEF